MEETSCFFAAGAATATIRYNTTQHSTYDDSFLHLLNYKKGGASLPLGAQSMKMEDLETYSSLQQLTVLSSTLSRRALCDIYSQSSRTRKDR